MISALLIWIQGRAPGRFHDNLLGRSSLPVFQLIPDTCLQGLFPILSSSSWIFQEDCAAFRAFALLGRSEENLGLPCSAKAPAIIPNAADLAHKKIGA